MPYTDRCMAFFLSTFFHIIMQHHSIDSADLLKAVLENSDQGIVILSPDHQVVGFNKVFAGFYPAFFRKQQKLVMISARIGQQKRVRGNTPNLPSRHWKAIKENGWLKMGMEMRKSTSILLPNHIIPRVNDWCCLC